VDRSVAGAGAATLADASDQSAIVMINLLRYRDRADYPQGSDARPCSGREAYQRYGALVLPMLGEVGASVLWRAPDGDRT
jgi:hypothetical protein